MKALIVVDVQNDFVEGGSLAVEGGRKVAQRIAEYVKGDGYDFVVATRDFHNDPGEHWSETPDYVDSWPRHCEIGTPGAEFCKPITHNLFDAVFHKGAYTAAYSGFEGHSIAGDTLGDWLRGHLVTEVDVCGIATDYCVKATALDAVKEGLSTTVLTSLVAAVTPDTGKAALAELKEAGVRLRDA